MKQVTQAFKSPDLIGQIIIIMASAVLSLACTGCDAGGKARELALWPSIDTAWPGVRADAECGGAERTTLDTFEGAIEDRDSFAVSFEWPVIKTAATSGIGAQIGDGVIGPGVSESKLERVRQFDEAVSKLIRAPPSR